MRQTSVQRAADGEAAAVYQPCWAPGVEDAGVSLVPLGEKTVTVMSCFAGVLSCCLLGLLLVDVLGLASVSSRLPLRGGGGCWLVTNARGLRSSAEIVLLDVVVALGTLLLQTAL